MLRIHLSLTCAGEDGRCGRPVLGSGACAGCGRHNDVASILGDVATWRAQLETCRWGHVSRLVPVILCSVPRTLLQPSNTQQQNMELYENTKEAWTRCTSYLNISTALNINSSKS